MPKGFSGVRKVADDVRARRAAGGSGSYALWFQLDDNETATVRFLEQGDDIHWAEMHEVPVDGRAWGRDVPCLDQQKDGTPCPGCEQDLPRRFKGYINLIWEEAPVFKREQGEGDKPGKLVKENGKPVVIGHEPQIAVWNSGIRLFEELDEIDANYKGLTSRRFKIKRKGKKLDTKYTITPADIDGGAQDFSDAEKALADKKYDLNVYVTPPSYDDFGKEQQKSGSGSSNSGGSDSGSSSSKPSANPFMRNRS